MVSESQQIVDKESALLKLPNETPVAVVSANHKTMCKFSDEYSNKYRPVWRAILTLCMISADEQADRT